MCTVTQLVKQPSSENFLTVEISSRIGFYQKVKLVDCEEAFEEP